jgi:hypothetical protein
VHELPAVLSSVALLLALRHVIVIALSFWSPIGSILAFPEIRRLLIIRIVDMHVLGLGVEAQTSKNEDI